MLPPRTKGLGFYNTAGDKPPPYGFMRFLIVGRGCGFTRHPTATLSYHDPLHFIQRVILSKGAARVELLRVEGLPEQAKAQGVSRSGISNGITIAFVRKVTFVKKAIKAPCETPLALLAFLFAYHGKQKFDFVEVVFAVRSHKITSLHSAQGDAGELAPLLRMTQGGCTLAQDDTLTAK